MCQTGEIGDFNYEQQKNGTFLYKAKDSSLLVPVVKKKDKAQFKVIDTMEGEMKKSGKQMIEKTGIDILKFLKNLK